MITIKSIADKLLKSKNIAIIGHISPDFDCFGSAFSLQEGLSLLGKNAKIFCDGKLHEHEKRLFDEKKLNPSEFKKEDFDTIILVDTPGKKRSGKYAELFQGHKNILRLDHHVNTINDITNFYTDPNRSSCAELVFDLLTALKCKITPKIATYIYAGILGDTNSFINDNTNAKTFDVASKVVECKADVNLCKTVFLKSKSLKQWELSRFIYKNAKFYDNFAIVYIPFKVLNKLNLLNINTSGFANEMTYIKEINIACTVTEREKNKFNVSFRSKGKYNVEQIAQKFAGGGHKQAAACILTGKISSVKKKLIKEIEKYLKSERNND